MCPGTEYAKIRCQEFVGRTVAVRQLILRIEFYPTPQTLQDRRVHYKGKVIQAR